MLSEDLWWNVCINIDSQLCSLYVGYSTSCCCLIAICFVSLAVCYVLINCFVFSNLFVLCSYSCFVRFAFCIVFCVLFNYLFPTFYSFTNHCNRLDTKLQLTL
jgi:hypothetical protein